MPNNVIDAMPLLRKAAQKQPESRESAKELIVQQLRLYGSGDRWGAESSFGKAFEEALFFVLVTPFTYIAIKGAGRPRLTPVEGYGSGATNGYGRVMFKPLANAMA